MHALFLIYGERDSVERTLRCMEAQAFFLPMTKGKKSKTQIITGRIRQLPLGVYEYIFPKGHVNEVLTSLRFHEKDPYYQKYGMTYKAILPLIRKAMQAEPIPVFTTAQKLPWVMEDTAFIPLGVRYDVDYVNPEGWTQEGL